MPDQTRNAHRAMTPLLAHQIRGSGPLVVLLHAVGLQGSWWEPYVDALQAPFRVLTVDLLGHGGSPLPAAPLQLSDHALEVGKLISHFGGPAHVVGVSMGGMVAQILALAQPDLVKSLALLSTVGGFSEEARPSIAARGAPAMTLGMAACVEETIERWVLPGTTDSEFSDRCRAQLRGFEPASWAANWTAISRLDVLPQLKQLKCPVLVLTGTEDRATPPAAAHRIAEAIPQAIVDLVDGAAHMGAFEKVDEFLPRLRAFLVSHSN